ncbi:MAG: GAF domain-containing protein [Vicinamibacteria bacterium]|nr:GAF domain-containing protein [Vicinamibacteria bacterium]
MAEAETTVDRGRDDALRPEEIDVINQLVDRNLRQDDIRRILLKLSSSDRDAFTSKLAEMLRKTSALLTVSRRLADSLSLDVLLPRMVELISEFLEAERCTVFLYDKDTDELYTKVALGLTTEIRIPAGAGIAGAVFRSGDPVHIGDAYQDPRFNPDVDRRTGFKTRNILCVPIKHKNDDGVQTVGVAQVLNKRSGDFAAEDLTLLETLNSQAAAAFVNALLHQEIRRARAEEVQLLEVTAAMSTELQLQPLLLKIMETVATILEADRATLFMHDSRARQLWAPVGQGENLSEIRFPDHLGIAGAVFTTGATVNIPDAYADPRFNQAVDKKTGYRTVNILTMPVVNRRGETIAVTQVLNKKGGAFTAIDEKRLRAFSAQASIAMENATLFDEVTRVKNYNESILESMTNGVITVNAMGEIVKANRAALGMVKRKASEVSGHNVSEFFRGPNAWIAASVESVRLSGRAEVAMEASLNLSDDGEAGGSASMNLSVVPLPEGKDGQQGCILMMEDITKEKRLKSTMARYMTKEVADKLLEEGEAALGGKVQRATLLFTDIRGFTSISERIGAQETVKMLNEYFTIMVDIILEKGGILDKYIGDAIMAVFGAPFRGPEDADHAVQTAVEMLRSLREFNAKRMTDGQEAVRMGIGVNTDDVLSGNIGSLKRMDYTVIGDGVNLASRLESANKAYGTELLVSEFTVSELKGSYAMREVDKMRVKGKSQPVGVFEILDHFGERSAARNPTIIELFAEGQRGYRRRDWEGARRRFEGALALNPFDGVARMYRDRCDYFSAHPPAPDWDGVWDMKEK